MLKIYRGKLDIKHPVIQNKIHNKLRRTPFKLELREFKKFIFFLQHPKEIMNPITIMIVNGELLHMHPGNFRLQAAYFSGQQYIDCVCVTTDDDRSNSVVDEFIKDQVSADDIILYQNTKGGWWEINTEGHKQFSTKDSISGKVFDRWLDDVFDKFKQKTKDYEWPEIYQNTDAVKQIEFTDREGLFQSVCLALDIEIQSEPKFKITSIK
jgi:hypothetical protein